MNKSKYTHIQIDKYTKIQEYKTTNIQTYEYRHNQVYKQTNIYIHNCSGKQRQACTYTDVHIHKYRHTDGHNTQIYECSIIRVYKYTHIHYTYTHRQCRRKPIYKYTHTGINPYTHVDAYK